MSQYPINNAHVPFNGINGSLVNIDSSSVGGIPFTNTIIPKGLHTVYPTGSNIQSAAGIYPSFNGQKGGKGRKINRNKINKISRKYKMKGSRKTVRNRVRRMKNKMCSKHLRNYSTRSHSRRKSLKRGLRKGMRGGTGTYQSPMIAPNYAEGYNQYNNNNGSLSNTYSTGASLSAASSALANPVPYQKLGGDVDNLNHNTLNSYGNIGSGSGFASRGWY